MRSFPASAGSFPYAGPRSTRHEPCVLWLKSASFEEKKNRRRGDAIDHSLILGEVKRSAEHEPMSEIDGNNRRE
jgi:hypothetical protein